VLRRPRRVTPLPDRARPLRGHPRRVALWPGVPRKDQPRLPPSPGGHSPLLLAAPDDPSPVSAPPRAGPPRRPRPSPLPRRQHGAPTLLGARAAPSPTVRRCRPRGATSGGAQLKSKVWQRTSKNTIAFSLILFLLVSSWTSHIAHYWSAAIAHSGMLPPCARMHVHVDGKSLRWAPMCMCVRAEAAMGVAVWSSPSGWRPGGLAVKHQDRGAGAQR
jgi:hypothetical protein